MISSIHLDNTFSYDTADIDFRKGKVKYREQYVLDNALVNPIAVYGANGSGKSSLFLSLQVIWFFLLGDINKVSFVPNLTLNRNSSMVSITFLIEGDEYRYEIGVVGRQEPSLFENLSSLGKTLFERKGTKYTLFGKESLKDIAPNYPLLRQIGIESYPDGDPRVAILLVYEEFSNMCFVTSTGAIFSKLAMREGVDALIMRKNEEILSFQSRYSSPFPRYKVSKANVEPGIDPYRYTYVSSSGKEIVYSPLFLSSGVKSQYRVLSSVLSLPKGSTILIDEIDNSLHTLLLRDFIDELSKQGYQLIFSSHDTNLLEGFRPDQVFFCSWRDGVSRIRRLSAMYPAIREINNIESMYLRGVFDEKINE